MKLKVALLPLFWLYLASCGYRMTSQLGGNPQGISRVAIPLFQNETLETGIEWIVTELLKDQFRLSPSWDLVPRSEAEGVLLGRIVRYETAPQSFVEGQDSVLAFTVRMKVELELQDRKGGSLWRGEMEEEERYDLADTVLQTKDNEREAARRLAKRMMQEVRERIQLDF